MNLYVSLICISFNWDLVELFQLVEATVPIVEDLVEVNELHGHVFDCLLAKLFLVGLNYHSTISNLGKS